MELYVREVGAPASETIVFLHGGGAAGWMWQPVIDRLAEFHSLAPDLPEHGGSRLARPFSMAAAAQATADAIRTRVGAKPVHLVGLSLGAQVLAALLSQAPDLAASAVISSALLRPLPGAKLGLYSPGMARAMYWSTVGPLKGWDAWIRVNMKYSAGVPDAYFEQFKQDFKHLTADGFANVMAANMSFRMPDGLERVTAPVLVLAGKKEYAAMRQSARDLAAALPNARLYEVDGGPGWSMAEQHNWALKDPALFADTVRAWVTGQPLPERLHLAA